MNLLHEDLKDEIANAIAEEIKATPKFIDYPVKRVEQEGPIWKVFVTVPDTRSAGLDESFEGASAWWAGPPKGAADVLSVIPENEQINLRFATSPLHSNGMLRIYPPQYLEKLSDAWQVPSIASASLEWLRRLEMSENQFDSASTLKTHDFEWLRVHQKGSFILPGWNFSFLWGPPGTGKTTTLGALLARMLVQFNNSRILLLSTTNTAVDQALVAVDKAIERKRAIPSYVKVRSSCFRIGNHFLASNFVGREHLIPVKRTDLIEKLSQLEARRPSVESVREFANWKSESDGLRAELSRQSFRVLETSRLSAMTTTRAVFTFDALRNLQKFDYVVFDESSQVGLAHLLLLLQLGKRVLFAGDHKQLAPIVRSEVKDAKAWLGRSVFHYRRTKSRANCDLTEQSRMNESICKIVSNVFYEGKLQVASDCAINSTWQSERAVSPTDSLGNSPVSIALVDSDGIWSQNYRGFIRFDSAKLIVKIVQELSKTLDSSKLLVLTPFRAQRGLIRRLLRLEEIRNVHVSTVHRAQGSERHTVIFDPVSGSNPFLMSDEANRLINVAISRAMARFVMLISNGDKSNTLLNQICNLIDAASNLKNARPISELIHESDFPRCLINVTVRIAGRTGTVFSVSKDGKSFQLADADTGKSHKYQTSIIVENFG